MERIQLKQQNARFLETIRKPMETGKKIKSALKLSRKWKREKTLRKKEFAKIHWAFWERGNNHFR